MSFSTNKFQHSRPKPTISKNRLIIGRKPMIEALKEAKSIEKIFILKSATGEEISQIRKMANELNIAVSYVPTEKLDRMTTVNHQGVVAIAGLIEYQGLQEIIDVVVDKGETPLLVVLDGITDTRNLGAIARSAYCYGAHAIVVPSSNNAAITEESIKTSAGALESIPVCRVPSIQQAIDVFKANGILSVATTLQTETNLNQVDLTYPCAIILGAEDKGVSSFVLKSAEHLIKIPMSDKFDSLNVSVAAGIMLYETFQQRNK